LKASDVADLIAEMRAGTLSLEQLAEVFRARRWERARRPAPTTDEERAAQLDPAPHVPGSIDDLTRAYDRGELTWEQYRVLADAVADSIDAECEAAGRDFEAGASE